MQVNEKVIIECVLTQEEVAAIESRLPDGQGVADVLRAAIFSLPEVSLHLGGDSEELAAPAV